ncbi:AMP-binding protein [Fulvivirgaceae bacterium PWU4]|uniref:AMP-binding protein n=1 Tax=Chryseosolibacter histidini TaxID=2782349 RepID=A0AAP2DNM7_9BACT|nr:AMP-binding protein [Chryseosolibacter histidini]MBT1697394.1 AMP-binding protein [Chryseosolibacter histidini]
MSYPYASIWINGRTVLLDMIVQDQVKSQSTFEESTFTFMREWLSGEETFTAQTSGSTGEPKVITFTREQMMASARLTAQALSLRPSYQALVCIDTRYIGGKMMLARSFVTGMKILAVDPCACPLQKIPVDTCVNFAAFVPYQVQSMLVSKHPHFLNNPDVAIIGGAPLDEQTIGQLQGLLCRCYATYGMTETLSHIALRALNGAVRDEQFHTLPGISLHKDERGCLVAEVPFLKERVVTNDLVEITGHDRFQWLGRWDNVINSGGVKVIPEKVEAALEKIFSEAGITSRFFVHGIPDKTFGNKVVLVVEAAGHTQGLLEKIFPEILARIPAYERPREVLITENFSATGSGKINRGNTLKNIHSSFTIRK